MDKCQICNSHSIQHFKLVRIENNKIELLKCEKCKFTFQKNFNKKKLDYDKGYYLREKIISPTFLINKANYKFNLIKPFLKNKKSLLEIGCSTGEFLEICKDNNLNVSGLEISGKAVDICQKKSLPIIKGDTKILKNTYGDPKKRALDAMKTAMTMSSAVFASLGALYFISSAQMINDMALVLLIGAFFDIINTWFQSLSMVLWYVERKEL